MSSHFGYPCRITFDGTEYTVTDLNGKMLPETFKQIQVSFRAVLGCNPDETDANCYCISVNTLLKLTLPDAICRQIREGTFPITK